MTGLPGGGEGGFGAGGNFIEQLLRDLLPVLGGAGQGDRLELARGLARSVATGNSPAANVDPMERIRLEELVRVAELHVAELTGLSPTPSGAPLVVDALGPGAWAAQTVGDWRFLLDTMTAGAGTPMAVPEALGGEQTADLMAAFMAGMGPMLAAMQLGSAVGHLARATLGQYEVPIPRPPGAGLLLVPANIATFAEDWSLQVDEVRLWVCLREVTVHAVLGRPYVADRLRQLLVEVVEGMTGEAAGLVEQLQRLDLSDPSSLEQMLSDPDALLGAEPSPQRRRASDELMAATAALIGYVEHVLDQMATRLLGGRGALAEAWRRRQIERDAPARTAEMLFGLDLGPSQVEQGVEFVNGVLARAGEEGLGELWAAPGRLPTPAEITAPGLWLARIRLAPDDAG